MPPLIEKFIGEFTRSGQYDRAKKNDKGGIRTIVATEKPTIVYDRRRWEPVREILRMDGAILPETRKVPLLDSHSLWGTSSIMGSTRELTAENDELIGYTYVSKTAERQATLIEEEHLDSCSAGYRTFKDHSVLIAQGEQADVGGRTYKNDYADGLPLIIRTQWEIYENSLVGIGADDRAKLKRQFEAMPQIDEYLKRIDETIKTRFEEFEKDTNQRINNIKVEASNMPGTNDGSQVTREEQVKIDAPLIAKFGRERYKGKYQDIAMRSIENQETYDEFQRTIYDQIEKDGYAVETPPTKVDMDNGQRKEYRISKAVEFIGRRESGRLRNGEDGGLEMEVHEEIVKRIGQPKKGNLYIPMDITERALEEKMERAHTAGTASEGGYSVATALRDDLLVKAARNDTVLGRLGCTILAGQRDNITIPKILSGLDAQVVAENTGADASYITLGQLSATPHHVSAKTEYGRQLFYQSSLSFDNILIEELNEAKNVKVDYLGLNGSGVGTEPLGLFNMSGITDIDMSTVSWRQLLEFRKQIKKSNAYKGNFKWGMSADVETTLMSTQKVNGQAIMLMNDDGKMVNAESETSNQITDQGLAFANWKQLYMIFWGVDELLVNPYLKGNEGMVVLNIFTMFDVLLRENAAVAISDNFTNN